jgi:ABC-type nitrate/sulfonate/bicarbonate transport system permease component
MKLSLKGLAIAFGLLWGGALLCAGLTNLAMPSYGMSFLQAMSSVYPWFHASRTIGDVLIGTLDGFVDGVICGLLFGWLYNAFSGS